MNKLTIGQMDRLPKRFMFESAFGDPPKGRVTYMETALDKFYDA